MAQLTGTTIKGDFIAEDTIIDLNDNIGSGEDPDSWFSGSTGIHSGARINRGGETDALFAWNEDENRWEVGIEGSMERVLTEADKGSITAADSLDGGTNVEVSTNASTGDAVIDAVASGSQGEVQINENGLFGTSPDLVFDDNADRLTSSGGFDMSNGSTLRIGGRDVIYLDWSSGNAGFALGPSAKDHVEPSAAASNVFVRAEDGSAGYSLSGGSNVVIGDFTATTIDTSEHVVVGTRAAESVSLVSGSESTSVGARAAKNASELSQTTFVGAAAGQDASGTDGSQGSVAVGHSALRSSSVVRSVAVGQNAGRGAAGASDSTFLGYSAGRTKGDYTQAQSDRGIAVGTESFTTSAGQLAVGAPSDKGDGGAISDAFLGKGVEATDPTEITIHGTNAQIIQNSKNASKAGADITVATGKGSGSATGASFRVKTAEPETTDYTEQSLVERLRVNATGLYITQAPSSTSSATELLSRDSGTGEVQSIAPADLSTGKTYTATTTGSETQTAVNGGGSPTYDTGTAVNFEIHVVAQVSSTASASLTNAVEGDTHTFEIEGSAVNRGSGVELVGTPDVNSVSYDVPVNDLEVGLATSGQDLQIQVTGVPDVTVEWAAEVLDTEIDLS